MGDREHPVLADVLRIRGECPSVGRLISIDKQKQHAHLRGVLPLQVPPFHGGTNAPSSESWECKARGLGCTRNAKLPSKGLWGSGSLRPRRARHARPWPWQGPLYRALYGAMRPDEAHKDETHNEGKGAGSPDARMQICSSTQALHKWQSTQVICSPDPAALHKYLAESRDCVKLACSAAMYAGLHFTSGCQGMTKRPSLRFNL